MLEARAPTGFSRAMFCECLGRELQDGFLKSDFAVNASGEIVVAIVVVAAVVPAVALVVDVLARSRRTARWIPTWIHVGVPTWTLR